MAGIQANIQRTIFWAASFGDDNVRRKVGSRGIVSGVIPVFWKDGFSSAVEFRVLSDDGHDDAVADLGTYDKNGLKLELTTQYNPEGYRMVKVTKTGGDDGRALLGISVVLNEPERLTFNGLAERIRNLESQGGGSSVAPNAHIADVTATSMAAAVKPASGADAAALVAALGPIVDTLNVNRSVTMDMRSKLNLVFDALEAHGILASS